MIDPVAEIAQLHAQIAQLEEDLAYERKLAEELTAATEWGRAGCLWFVGYYSGDRPIAHRTAGEVEARTLLADWDPGDPYPPVLLRAECTAPHRWPLTPEEADATAPSDLPD